MRLIIKTRLGAPVIPGMEKLQRYSCGLCSQPYFGQDFAAHFLSCTAMTATEGLKRHNQIARIVAKYIERGGGSAIRELYARVTNSSARTSTVSWACSTISLMSRCETRQRNRICRMLI